MNPLAIKGIAILLAVLAIFGILKGIHHHIYQQGWSARDTQAKKDEASIKEDMQKKYDADVAAAHAETDALRLKFDTTMTERAVKERQYENRIAVLENDARAGRLKLSIAVSRCSVSGDTQGTNTAAAGGTSAETRADIMPEVAATVLGIAADNARDVRDYNRVLDLYEEARRTCNAVDR